VIICKELNEVIWENGIKNPPGKVSVVALKTDINGVEKTLVNLAEAGIDTQKSIYEDAKAKATDAMKKEIPATKEKSEVKEAEVAEVKEKKSEAKSKPTERKKGGGKEE